MSLLASLTPTQYIVFSVIACTQGKNGYSDVTQEQIVRYSPLKSTKSVRKAIEDLLSFTYNGKPILKRFVSYNNNGRIRYKYQVLPNPLFAVYGEKVSIGEIDSNIEEFVSDIGEIDSSIGVTSSHSKEFTKKFTKEYPKEVDSINKNSLSIIQSKFHK